MPKTNYFVRLNFCMLAVIAGVDLDYNVEGGCIKQLSTLLSSGESRGYNYVRIPPSALKKNKQIG